jgi:hypothetical protein
MIMYECVYLLSGEIVNMKVSHQIQFCGTLFFIQNIRRLLGTQNVDLFFSVNSNRISGQWNCNVIKKDMKTSS